MEFEDLKLIWDKQDNEPLYAIDTAALDKRIQSKSRSVEQTLNILDIAVIGSSIILVFVLYISGVGDGVPAANYLIPAMLLIISGYLFSLRRLRRRNAQQYETTMVGELNKAIAHYDYLLERFQTMVWWYMLPVFGGFAAYFFLEKLPYWRQSIVAMAVFGMLSYIAVRWESRKVHLPQKRDLEALRELLQSE